jgi:hypothetical protein
VNQRDTPRALWLVTAFFGLLWLAARLLGR